MVDWSLARNIAQFAAGTPGAVDLGVDLAPLATQAQEQVARYTRLEAKTAIPPLEAVDRREWAEVNLATLAKVLDPVTERLEDRTSLAGPFAGILRSGASALLAIEVGLVVGYMSQHVLGQYELALLQSDADPEPAPPRLLLVAPNLEQALTTMGLDREDFLMWIVLHESTHAYQFAGVPWLREHLAGLLGEYLKTVELKVDEGVAKSLPTSLPNPGKLVADFREGGLAALVQTDEQRRIMDRVQATMAVVEGYSEHVMDAVAAESSVDFQGMRVALDRKRASRSTPERILRRLLGFDLKLRQYELGKRFCDWVSLHEGVDCLNVVWSGPDALPTLAELTAPADWVARVKRGQQIPA